MYNNLELYLIMINYSHHSIPFFNRLQAVRLILSFPPLFLIPHPFSSYPPFVRFSYDRSFLLPFYPSYPPCIPFPSSFSFKIFTLYSSRHPLFFFFHSVPPSLTIEQIMNNFWFDSIGLPPVEVEKGRIRKFYSRFRFSSLFFMHHLYIPLPFLWCIFLIKYGPFKTVRID